MSPIDKKPWGFGIGCGFGEGLVDGGGGFRIVGRDRGESEQQLQQFHFCIGNLHKYIFVHFFGKYFPSSYHKAFSPICSLCRSRRTPYHWGTDQINSPASYSIPPCRSIQSKYILIHKDHEAHLHTAIQMMVIRLILLFLIQSDQKSDWHRWFIILVTQHTFRIQLDLKIYVGHNNSVLKLSSRVNYFLRTWHKKSTIKQKKPKWQNMANWKIVYKIEK